MKTKNIFFTLMFLLIATSMIFQSCRKKVLTYNLDTDYFEVQNAEYVKKPFPEPSSGPEIEDVYGNTSVLPGGSNPIRIKASSADLANVLIGVEDVGGYYKLPITSTTQTDDIILFYILLKQNLAVDTFIIVIALQDNQGQVSEHHNIMVHLVEAGTGVLQVSCSWDQLNDVDLHLIEPNGEEIYYGNSTSGNGGELDVDSNPACDIDSINNENITYDADDFIENGEYTVKVALYSNCNISSSTNYSVTVYYQGALITPSYGSNPYNSHFNPDDVNDEVIVMKFQIPPTSKSIVSDMKPVLKFNYKPYEPKPKVLSPEKM